MPLTDTAIRNAKSRAKQYKLTDEKGMYVLVKRAGKRKTFSLGVYPDVKLAEAREKRDKAKKLIANDVDPGQMRKATKVMQVEQPKQSLNFGRLITTRYLGCHILTLMACGETKTSPSLSTAT